MSDRPSFTDTDRAAMRESFRRLLASSSREQDVRRAMDTPLGYEPAFWAEIGKLGLAGLVIDPEFGGLGAGPEEVEQMMEEAGAHLLCAPWLASSIVAAGLLLDSSDSDAKSRLLPSIASGERVATLAVAGKKGTWTAQGVSVVAVGDGAGWRVDGESHYVLSAGSADVLLVVATAPDGMGTFEVDPRGQGVTISAQETWDRTLRLSRIAFDRAPAARIVGADWKAVERTLDLARVALAGEQAGAAKRIFDITLDYIKTRVQFGRPVGGFQAIKHMAADLLLEVESAISAARHAARSLARGVPDAESSISLAAFVCADAFVQVAASAIQMHGGIAFTWEHPAHLYLRRARADAQLFGSPSFFRERYVAALEAGR